MKAWIIKSFGPPNVFEEADVPKPVPGDGEVLIRVKATSVNPVDCKIRAGLAARAAPVLPAILHGDVSGVIEQTGPNVTALHVGDEVYACAGGVKGHGGALAEYMIADVKLVARKASNLSWAQAAALPLVSLTAWEALVDRAKVREGQKVLIHAGTGGVGHVAVQIAKQMGAQVFATVSSDAKATVAKSLGADVTINYKQKKVSEYVQEHTNGKGFELVIDTVGRENLDRSFEAAALGGTVVSISTMSTHDLSLMHTKGLSLHVVFMLIPLVHGVGREHQGKILNTLSGWSEQNKFKPLLHPQTFPMTEVAKAHALWESGKAEGKIVLLAD